MFKTVTLKFTQNFIDRKNHAIMNEGAFKLYNDDNKKQQNKNLKKLIVNHSLSLPVLFFLFSSLCLFFVVTIYVHIIYQIFILFSFNELRNEAKKNLIIY